VGESGGVAAPTLLFVNRKELSLGAWEEAEVCMMMARLATIAKVIWRSLEWFSTQLGWITGALTAIMMLAVLREVIGRYIFNYPSDWSIEFTCYLVVGMGYLAAPYTELLDRHIRIDFIHVHFKGKTKYAVDILIPSVGLIWCALLVWQGWILAWDSFVTNACSETIMMWPLFPSQVMVPIGAFLLCLVLIGRIVQNIDALLKEKK
jgi:TRAP-type C4-dicarboxylate transport system permease small subunit